jgi:hypothetical protein
VRSGTAVWLQRRLRWLQQRLLRRRQRRLGWLQRLLRRRQRWLCVQRPACCVAAAAGCACSCRCAACSCGRGCQRLLLLLLLLLLGQCHRRWHYLSNSTRWVSPGHLHRVLSGIICVALIVQLLQRDCESQPLLLLLLLLLLPDCRVHPRVAKVLQLLAKGRRGCCQERSAAACLCDVLWLAICVAGRPPERILL